MGGVIMGKILAGLVAAALAVPAQAAGWDPGAETRYGAFIGARVQLPLGGKRAAAPRAELALAPTHSRVSSTGLIDTRIGQGIALHFPAKGKPALTIGGVRSDRLLRINSSRTVDPKQKLGVSKGVWIGVGVAAAAVVVGAVLLNDYCDHKIADVCGDKE